MTKFLTFLFFISLSATTISLKTSPSICYLSNSFYNVSENIDLAFIAKINEKIKANAVKFLNKDNNNNSDINVQTSKHLNHFNLILRDTHTIDRKLEKITSAFTPNFPYTHTDKLHPKPLLHLTRQLTLSGICWQPLIQ